jgi:hypothetical protein
MAPVDQLLPALRIAAPALPLFAGLTLLPGALRRRKLGKQRASAPPPPPTERFIRGAQLTLLALTALTYALAGLLFVSFASDQRHWVRYANTDAGSFLGLVGYAAIAVAGRRDASIFRSGRLRAAIPVALLLEISVTALCTIELYGAGGQPLVVLLDSLQAARVVLLWPLYVVLFIKLRPTPSDEERPVIRNEPQYGTFANSRSASTHSATSDSTQMDAPTTYVPFDPPKTHRLI